MSWKSFRRATVWTLSIVIALPLLLYLALQFSSVQTFLINRIANYLTEEYHVKVHIARVDIDFFRSVVLEGFYVEDPSRDTLMYADALNAEIGRIGLRNHELGLNRITLEHPVIHLVEDSSGRLNLDYLLDAFAGDTLATDTVGNSWKISCANFTLEQGDFVYRKYQPDTVAFGLNFDDLHLRSLNLSVDNIELGDTIQLFIPSFSFREQSGLAIQQFSSRVLVAQTGIELHDFELRLDSSYLHTSLLALRTDSLGDFSDFMNRVRIATGFSEGNYLSTSDLAYLVSDLKGLSALIMLRGQIHGPLSDMHLDNFELVFDRFVRLDADLALRGLPDSDSLYISATIRSLTTSFSALSQVPLPPFDQHAVLGLPGELNGLGNISLDGRFDGTLSDFVTSLHINTGAGNVIIEGRYKESPQQLVAFDGSVKTSELDFGKLEFIPKELSRARIDMKVTGSGHRNNPLIVLDGSINELVYSDYAYQTVRIDGEYLARRFNGELGIQDPNVSLLVKGDFDFSDKIPVLDFTLAVEGARLDTLGFDTSRVRPVLDLHATANFLGNSIDNLQGEFFIMDISYDTEDHLFATTDISIRASDTKAKKTISLSSELLEAKIEGHFLFDQIVAAYKRIASVYAPQFLREEELLSAKADSTVNFKFFISLKETVGLTKLFMPGLSITPGTGISGQFDAARNFLYVRATTPGIAVDDLHFATSFVTARNEADYFHINCGSESVMFSDNAKLGNLALEGKIRNDSLDFALRWNNWDTLTYRGDIGGVLTFDRNRQSGNSVMNVRLKPSEIIMADSVWRLSSGRVAIDTSAIRIDSIVFRKGKEALTIFGAVSENPQDFLVVGIDHIDLDILNRIIRNDALRLGGVLSGSVAAGSLYKQPVIFTQDTLFNLMINESEIGDLHLNSRLLSDNRLRVEMLLRSGKKRNTESLMLSGYYSLDNDGLEFDVAVDKFKLEPLEPLLAGTISDIRGQIDNGAIAIRGTTENPQINGILPLYRMGLRVDYLNTRYNFTDTLIIENSNIYIQELQLNASDKSTAVVNGAITHTNFSDIRFDIRLVARNFLFLNTSVEDNELFYGTAYASGIIEVEGTPDVINMKASIQTRKNTQFFIPLTSTEEVSENNFITFINKGLFANVDKEEYEVDLSGINMDFELDVTPDAEVQLVFDEKVGDIIKGRGTGTIRMIINAAGDFSMFGEFGITYGDYLFTLQNIINKRFTVEEGGTIVWNGDPYNALVDMTANYFIKKVPLYDLVVDDEFKETRVDVTCILKMTGSLLAPTIGFSLKVTDKIDEKIVTKLNNLSEDDISKQVLSLLIINRFQPFPGLKPENQEISFSTGEMISNQLSHWLSQISNSFDIGVNYRPGDEISTKELEVALSTQLFNDRITVNGNVGVGGGLQSQSEGQSNLVPGSTSNLAGEFEVDVKITDNGKFRVKAFTQANDNTQYEVAPYTHGIGFFFREDFNNLGELRTRYAQKRQERRAEKEEEKERKRRGYRQVPLPGEEKNEDEVPISTEK